MNTSGSSAVSMAAPKSVVDRIIGIFVSPRATMEDIVARPTWLIPFIIVSLMAIGAGYLLSDLQMQTAIENVKNNPKMTQEQIDAAVKGMEARMGSPVALSIGLAIAPIAILVVWAVITGVFLFSGNVVLGGQSTFKTIFSIISWSSFIGLPSLLLNTPIKLSKQSIEDATALNVLLSPDDKATFLYKLLGKLEIFTIWQVAIMGIGLAVAYKFSTGKGTAVVVMWWVIWILISIGFSSLFGGMFGG